LRHGNIWMGDIIDSLRTLWFQVNHTTQDDILDWQENIWRGIQQEGMTSSQTSRLELIIQKIALNYDISAGDIIWSSRKKEVSFARQMSMYIAKKHFNRSLQKIGNYFWGKNHASVIYAIRQFEEKICEDSWLEEKIETFM
jgi:chromosomal replication initiation ATPase DnaA